jgi:hypothetical protein
MMILMFDWKATDPAVPTWTMPRPARAGEVKQGRRPPRQRLGVLGMSSSLGVKVPCAT